MTSGRKRLLRQDAKALTIKDNTVKSALINPKNLCSSKDTNKRVKRQVTEWENMSTTQKSSGGFTYRIYV